MSRKRWHIDVQEGCYTLARHWPPRFDVEARAVFPAARPGRLAQQIRQDLWRKFQHLRGFSPVIQISEQTGADGLIVRAGGRVMRPLPAETANWITALLENPAHRARWISWAQERRT